MVTEAPPRVELNLIAPAQFDFFTSKVRHPAFIGGRGSGKTHVHAVKGGVKALESRGVRGVMTEPTFQMIRSNFVPVFDKVFGHLKVRSKMEEKQLGPGPNLWEYGLILQGTPQEIRFANGSLIELRPVDDPNKFRGPSLNFFGLDEVAYSDLHYYAFEILEGALRQSEDDQGWVTSTPSARAPWIKRLWKEKVTAIGDVPLDRPDWYELYQMSMEQNPHLPESTKIANRMIYGGTERRRREQLGGEFMGLEGLAFGEFGKDHIRPMYDSDEGERAVVGLDFGGTAPTAAIEIWYNPALDRVWATREFYERDCEDYDWIKEVGEWGVHTVACDPARSEKEIVELRRMYGLPGLKPARKFVRSFDGRYQRLKNRLGKRADGKPGIFISPQCPNLIDEIENLALKELRSGDISAKEWASGLRDHAYDALCYALGEVDRGYGELTNTKVKWSSG